VYQIFLRGRDYNALQTELAMAPGSQPITVDMGTNFDGHPKTSTSPTLRETSGSYSLRINTSDPLT